MRRRWQPPAVRTAVGRITGLPERRTISHIPAQERYGTARGLFAFWWGTNSSIYTVLAGTIGIAFGLSVGATMIACTIGVAIGCAITALHAAQGPRLGLPQMIQARAQFGYFGALIPSLLVLVMFLGFVVGYEVFLAQTLTTFWSLAPATAIALGGAMIWAVAAIGHRFIHRLNGAVAAVSALLLIVLLTRALDRIGATHHASDRTTRHFVLYVVICIGGGLSWAPYIADYTRYLPASTSARKTVTYTYLPFLSSSLAFALLGAIIGQLALSAVNANTVAYLSHLVPDVPALVAIPLGLSLLASAATGVYSPLLVAYSCLSTRGDGLPGAWVRLVGTAAIVALTCVGATFVTRNVISDLADFSETLVYVLLPWSAISLIDYYLIRRGHYDVKAILMRDGVYGRFNATTVGIYVVGVLTEIPFLTSAWPRFTGPVARALGGVNLALPTGFFLTAGLYIVMSRRRGPDRALPQDRRAF